MRADGQVDIAAELSIRDYADETGCIHLGRDLIVLSPTDISRLEAGEAIGLAVSFRNGCFWVTRTAES